MVKASQTITCPWGQDTLIVKNGLTIKTYRHRPLEPYASVATVCGGEAIIDGRSYWLTLIGSVPFIKHSFHIILQQPPTNYR